MKVWTDGSLARRSPAVLYRAGLTIPYCTIVPYRTIPGRHCDTCYVVHSLTSRVLLKKYKQCSKCLVRASSGEREGATPLIYFYNHL